MGFWGWHWEKSSDPLLVFKKNFDISTISFKRGFSIGHLMSDVKYHVWLVDGELKFYQLDFLSTLVLLSFNICRSPKINIQGHESFSFNNYKINVIFFIRVTFRLGSSAGSWSWLFGIQEDAAAFRAILNFLLTSRRFSSLFWIFYFRQDNSTDSLKDTSSSSNLQSAFSWFLACGFCWMRRFNSSSRREKNRRCRL